MLQAAHVLRRSLRFDLDPYNIRAQRLEEAWKKFSLGTDERANRLTVASMFIGQSDKVNLNPRFWIISLKISCLPKYFIVKIV